LRWKQQIPLLKRMCPKVIVAMVTLRKEVTLVMGASSGFGLLSAQALAKEGPIVYASMRETTGRNAPHVAEVAAYAREQGVDLRTVELDFSSEGVDQGRRR
jgi:NAD(P)-dependent dehydrogenase (short-subunit alcohol dehydrogenase family)